MALFPELTNSINSNSVCLLISLFLNSNGEMKLVDVAGERAEAPLLKASVLEYAVEPSKFMASNWQRIVHCSILLSSNFSLIELLTST